MKQSDLKPESSELASLPIPVSSKDLAQEPEYPSAAQLDDTHWAISTGSGSIYVLETSAIDERFSANLVARYDLDTPFLLRSAHLSSDIEAKLLLTRPTAVGEDVKTRERTFEVVEVSIDPRAKNAGDEQPGKLDIKWTLAGGDLPYWCEWSQGGWMVLSGEEFKETPKIEDPLMSAGPSGSTASSSRSGLGAVQPSTEDSKSSVTPATAEEERVWPYSWTQSSDSISMTIPFPSGTKRPDLTISLSNSELSLSLKDSAPATASPLTEYLRRPTRSFWSDIDAESSTFTFDPETSVLELEITKAEDHSRWPSVFSPLDDEEEEDEEEVPETLDASTLAAVRASFNNIKTRQPEEPIGNHPAMPALLTEEMDIDLDDDEDYDQAEGPFGDKGGKVGRDCFIGKITDGLPKWTRTTSTVVSLPIASSSKANEGSRGLVIKSAIDGLYFQPSDSGDISKTAWKHISTTPALAFVLSSKRDIQLVRHLTSSSPGSGTTVLAFDAGSYGAQAQGNVYVYYPPESKTHAKQGVVGVSGRERGALLGVDCIGVGGKDVVVVLCEKELVVLHDVL
jgi:hypothetical protein